MNKPFVNPPQHNQLSVNKERKVMQLSKVSL